MSRSATRLAAATGMPMPRADHFLHSASRAGIAVATLMAGRALAEVPSRPPQLHAEKQGNMSYFTPSGTMAQVWQQLGEESMTAYRQSPFSALSADYFARFSRDSAARAATGEVEITPDWSIRVEPGCGAVARRMARDLAQFLAQCMQVRLQVAEPPEGQTDDRPQAHGIILSPRAPAALPAGAFTISATKGAVVLTAHDDDGLRDAIAKLVETLGLRQAPFLPAGDATFTPRVPLRLGTVPLLGSYRDVAFMGYNAAFLSEADDFFALSASDAIPGLELRRKPEKLRRLTEENEKARQYGLKTFFRAHTVRKFSADDPIFQRNPDIRGALTWKAHGDYILCSEHPLVQQYYRETVQHIFREVRGLDGILIIAGGEGFYHCFMRAYGVPKGHTNCQRCEPLGPDRAVANLCNLLGEAAREINPKAEVCIWPYSAGFVWSSDQEQSGLIKGLKPGTALFTEVEKDETVEKADGIRKLLWDYSIDMIEPGNRARTQIALARGAGIPVYLKSEPEISLEYPGLSHIPCLDRWYDRAAAMAASGADGAWVFAAFRANYGNSPAEIYRYAWWDPAPRKEETLTALAQRIAGARGGPHLRRAWALTSEALGLMPEIPSYYRGPYYLGPAHPMCADPSAPLPRVFHGYYLFEAEETEADGLRVKPTYLTEARNSSAPYRAAYRRMEQVMRKAAAEVEAADPLVDERHRLVFGAETSPIRWLYHTVRSVANFLDSCDLRAQVALAADDAARSALCDRWLNVLRDEQANAQAALPVMENDMRLDMYYGGDHAFSHGADMIRAKLAIMEREINEYVPGLRKKSAP